MSIPTPDYAADIVQRTPGTNLRIATFNVENLFSRPRAMLDEDFSKGQPYLDDFFTLNSLFAKAVYDEQDQEKILELMKKHRLHVRRPNKQTKKDFLAFRQIRGKLLSSKNGVFRVAAKGRASWLGWVDLVSDAIKAPAISNTARVIAAVNPDVIALCEVENRPGLVKFHDNVLVPILKASGREGYEYAMVVDGNDPRGIDVGILSRYPVSEFSTHVFDRDGAGEVFPRDCCEYFVSVPGLSGRLIIMNNHFSSRGSDKTGMVKRIRQARRVAEIVDERLAQGWTHFMVCGDLNDTPEKPGLSPLTGHGKLLDAIAQFKSSLGLPADRLGTYARGKEQFDYLMMSPAVSAMARGAGIERRGFYAPRIWPRFDSVRDSTENASDHHCLWVDLNV